jgi:predicted esterase
MRIGLRLEGALVGSRVLIAGAACVVLSGCWSFHEAKGAREVPASRRSSYSNAVLPPEASVPAPDAATMWPGRNVSAAQRVLDQTPELILDFKVADGFDESRLTDADREYLGNWSQRVTHKGIYAGGLLRIVEAKDAASEADGLGALLSRLFTGFVPNAYYISSLDIEDPGLIEKTRLDIEETRELQANSSPRGDVHSGGLRSAQIDEEILLEEGVPMRLPPVLAEGASPYRGVLVRMAALAGNEYEQKVVEELERRGWAVVHVSTRTDASPYATRAQLDQARELDAELERLRAELREAFPMPPGADAAANFAVYRASTQDPRSTRASELHSRVRQLRSGIYDWAEGEPTESLAARIAERFDQTLAENAYAAEAALAYLAQQRPDVPQKPLVIVGFSAGAIATPTVAARLGERVDAAVLIGGGANALDIALRSELVKRSVPVERGGVSIAREELLMLRGPYLAASRLDPYHAAPLMRHAQLLMLHGLHDTWVPASSGELLYERLDRPQRLVMSGGHEFLFYFLPDKAEFIAVWLENATRR